jgi:hypothetical protein
MELLTIREIMDGEHEHKMCERERAKGGSMIDLFKWLLQVDIRWKNGLSALVALLSVAVFYFAARHSEWFREAAGRGSNAIVAVLAMVLLISFLAVWLILSGVAGIVTHCRSVSQSVQRDVEELRRIGDNLGATTDWQRSFLLRFITNDTTQINDWEVGGYKAIWGPELEVLCAKGIIRRYPSGVLEIVPEYRQYLKAFWDPATSTLKEM